MKLWLSEEINFLNTRLHVSPVQAFTEFSNIFGSTRSYHSIQKKLQQLKILQMNVRSEQSSVPLTAPLMSEEFPLQVKQWIDNLNDIIKDIEPITHTDLDLDAEEVSLVIQLSDIHVGKLTGSYNTEVARERIASIPQTIYNLEHNDAISDINVMLIGDIVDGEDIYPNHPTHVECPVLDQIQIATESIWQMLLQLHLAFSVPIRVFTAPGNHGRASKTVHERSNWDNVVYYTLATIAQVYGNPNIQVFPGYDEFTVCQIRDQIGLLYHNGVKHMGTPAMREKVAGWISSYGFTFLSHGHWHESNIGDWAGRTVIANGSMGGADDLSRRMGKGAIASQWYFKIRNGFSPYGMTKLEWS